MLWNMKVTLKPSLDIWIGYTASKKYTWSNINSFKLTALKMDSVAETKGFSLKCIHFINLIFSDELMEVSEKKTLLQLEFK